MRCSRIRRCSAISFVGSSPVAKHIYETGTRHGKRVQANGGAKNYIVVMPDADVPRTVEALATAAFGCAGERCMAGSTALTVGAAADRVVALVSRSRARDQSRPDRCQRHSPTWARSSPRNIAIASLSLVASGEKEGAKIICRRPRRPNRRCA